MEAIVFSFGMHIFLGSNTFMEAQNAHSRAKCLANTSFFLYIYMYVVLRLSEDHVCYL